MSYLVLARKWRPETFSQVVGQRHVVTTLAAAVRTNRIAHAYLFTGPRGVGKTTVARILAKALNCEKGPAEEPCATCTSCTEIANGKSLDVIEIDGASNRRIEDARGIRETVQYAPLSGRMKVYIIDEAHMLTREAFNALLKTLEEPPPHVVFVLATTEPSKIPDTIASRCQRFDFHRVAAADIEARLSEIADAEGMAIDEAALRLLAARADGSVRDAESLLDQLLSAGMEKVGPDDVAAVLGIPRTEVFLSLTDCIAARDTGAALKAFAAALDAGFDPGDLVDGLAEHLRGLLVATAARTSGGPVPPGQPEEQERPSASLTEDELVRLLKIAIDAQVQARWSTQPGFLLELALARMARMPRTLELSEVVRALEGARADTPRAASGGAPRDGGSSAVPPVGGREAAATASGPSGSGWDGVLTCLRTRKPALAAFLTDAVAAEPRGSDLEVHVPNGSTFHRQQLQDRGNMTLLEKAASDVFGRAIKVRLAFGETAVPQARSRAGTRGPEAAGSTDAVVKKVIEMFDGEITDSRRED